MISLAGNTYVFFLFEYIVARTVLLILSKVFVQYTVEGEIECHRQIFQILPRI